MKQENDRGKTPEQLSSEGLTIAQVEMVKFFVGTGMLDVLNPDEKKDTPYTLRQYGSAGSISTESIVACFPDVDIANLNKTDFRNDSFLFDNPDGIRQDMKRRPNSKKIYVVMDTQTGNIEKLGKDFEVQTAFTISQAYDCALRIMQERCHLLKNSLHVRAPR